MRYILDSEKITRFMINRNLTQDDFRKKVNITYRTLNNILLGRPIQIKVAKRISDAISVPFKDLVLEKVFGTNNFSHDKEVT